GADGAVVSAAAVVVTLPDGESVRLPAASNAVTTYVYVVDGDSPASARLGSPDTGCGTDPTFVPFRLTSYPEIPTSSDDRVHEIVADVAPTVVAVGFPGAVGGVPAGSVISSRSYDTSSKATS